jgi:hypothetical protein
MFCTKCGEKNPSDARFCFACGRRMYVVDGEKTRAHSGSDDRKTDDSSRGSIAQSPARQRVSPSFKGVRGWLYVVVVVCRAVMPTLLVFWAVWLLFVVATSSDATYIVTGLVFGVVCLLWAAFSIHTGRALAEIRPRAARTAKIYFLLWPLMVFCLNWPLVITGALGPEEAGENVGKSMWIGLLVFAYLLTSRRVKATYEEGTKTGAQEGQRF